MTRAILIIVGLIVIGIGLFWGLGEALVPLLLSFFMAYFLFPLIQKIESKGVPRQYAVSAVFVTLSLLFILAGALVIPSIIADTKNFIKEFPAMAPAALEKVESLSESMGYKIDLSKAGVKSLIEEQANDVSGNAVQKTGQVVKKAFAGISTWFIWLLNLTLIPIFFFYVINDFEKIIAGIKSYIPMRALKRVDHYLKISDEVLSGYIRGQFLVASILAVLYAIGLTLAGLKFGIVVGLLAGFISIVPYLGSFLGILTAMIISLANYEGPLPLLAVLLVFAIVQSLEGFVITPKLVGNKVGLSSFATILAIIIGGNLLGIIGMLVAIPVAAIGKSLLLDLRTEYQQLDFYRSK